MSFIGSKPFQIYDEKELLIGKLNMLQRTNMLDYIIDIRQMLYPMEDPETHKARRNTVVATLQQLQSEASVIMNIMSNEDAMKQMETMRDSKTLINYLQTQFDVS